MDEGTGISIIQWVLMGVGLLFLIICIAAAAFTVPQGSVAVVTRFGKYKRIALPGLNWKNPFLDRVLGDYSTQNQSTELKFQAITIDQANVYFKAMVLYAVRDSNEETIKLAAFKFIDHADLLTAMEKTIEGSVRSFVATKRQGEVLGLRTEIVEYVKEHIDKPLLDWGYHLLDLQVNDITFDDAITNSMSQVVASSNLKAAAENEGQALLIKKTKAAEAEGNAIKIQAAAEKEAATLRGQGVASFREEVSKGISESAKMEGVDSTMILFSMWTEALKNFAELGKGNTIFLDGSPEGMNRTIREMLSVMGGTKQTNGTPVNGAAPLKKV